MLGFLWQIHLRRFGRYFQKNRTAKIITVVLFLTVFCAVALGIYQFFYQGFGYLKNYPYFRPALILYAFEIFFLLIGFLVWVGSMIALLFSLFKDQRSAFILASPKFGILPRYTLISNAASSAWILLFVLAPALWAGAVVFHTGLGAFLLALIASLLAIVFAVLLAYVAVLAVAGTWRLLHISGSKFLAVSLSLALLSILVFGVVAAKISHHDVIFVFNSQNLKLSQAPRLRSYKILNFCPPVWPPKSPPTASWERCPKRFAH